MSGTMAEAAAKQADVATTTFFCREFPGAQLTLVGPGQMKVEFGDSSAISLDWLSRLQHTQFVCQGRLCQLHVFEPVLSFEPPEAIVSYTAEPISAEELAKVETWSKVVWPLVAVTVLALVAAAVTIFGFV